MKIFINIFGILFIVVLLGVLLCVPVKFMWDWTIPGIFGGPEITFWQAFKLMILCGILNSSSTSPGKSE